MTSKFIYTYRERCKTGPVHNRCWNWSPFTSKRTWMRFSKFWNSFPKFVWGLWRGNHPVFCLLVYFTLPICHRDEAHSEACGRVLRTKMWKAAVNKICKYPLTANKLLVSCFEIKRVKTVAIKWQALWNVNRLRIWAISLDQFINKWWDLVSMLLGVEWLAQRLFVTWPIMTC